MSAARGTKAGRAAREARAARAERAAAEAPEARATPGAQAAPKKPYQKRPPALALEPLPLVCGILAVFGWLYWYLIGALFGLVGLVLGIVLLRLSAAASADGGAGSNKGAAASADGGAGSNGSDKDAAAARPGSTPAPATPSKLLMPGTVLSALGLVLSVLFAVVGPNLG